MICAGDKRAVGVSQCKVLGKCVMDEATSCFFPLDHAVRY